MGLVGLRWLLVVMVEDVVECDEHPQHVPNELVIHGPSADS